MAYISAASQSAFDKISNFVPKIEFELIKCKAVFISGLFLSMFFIKSILLYIFTIISFLAYIPIKWIGVFSSFLVVKEISAPLFNNLWTAKSSLLITAKCKGVYPNSLVIFKFPFLLIHFCSNNILTIFFCLLIRAKFNGVKPPSVFESKWL